MATIKYKIGQERDIVREKDQYEDSIFKEQYDNALRLTSLLMDDISNERPKIVSFCGDRGDGKTSCMMSVIDLLEKKSDKTSVQSQYITSRGESRLKKTKFTALDPIDPSFFDDSHNVIELVVGQMYGKFLKKEDSGEQYKLRNDLLNAFQNVKRYLCVLHDKNLDAISSIHELDILSSTIALRSQLEKLVSLYLKYVEQDVLIIPVDDIDLDFTQAYLMCEHIRKYLSIQNCIVFMAVKIDQLQSIVAKTFSLKMEGGCTKAISINAVGNNDEYDVMAEKYIMKLLPTSTRVFMPKVYTFINSKIEIWDGDKQIMSARELKEAVVQLIFRTTRFLFYNQLGSISPIVPNNLREFFILIGLLSTMRQVTDSRDKNQKPVLEANKNKFKLYFYSVWKGRFDSEVQKRLDKLVNSDFGTSLNKEVIRILSVFLNNSLKKDFEGAKPEEFEEGSSSAYYSNETATRKIMNSLISDDNFGYNVSVGDVFFLLSNLEKETLSEEDYALVFFLKSFYSIKLYEAYDEVTEKEKSIYPIVDKSKTLISVIDHRFDHTNKLQQLLGGSYFTYSDTDLIAVPKKWNSIDLRIISGKRLHGLLTYIKDNIDANSDREYETQTESRKKELDRFNLLLQLAEFFMLTIRCAVRQKEFSRNTTISSMINQLRKNVDPFMYRKFYTNTGYFLFDVMAPFANIVNPQYAYQRFSIINDGLYAKIRQQNNSLLNQMIRACGREYIDDADAEWTQLHRLLSDSVIRNADVLSTVMDKVVLKRSSTHDKAYKTLSKFYQEIKGSSLATHEVEDGADHDEMTFHFLNPMQELLDKVIEHKVENEADVNPDYKDAVEWFDKIFGPDEKPVIDLKLPTNAEISSFVKGCTNSRTIKTRLLDNIVNIYVRQMIDDVFSLDADDNRTYSKVQRDEKLEDLYRRVAELKNSVAEMPTLYQSASSRQDEDSSGLQNPAEEVSDEDDNDLEDNPPSAEG